MSDIEEIESFFLKDSTDEISVAKSNEDGSTDNENNDESGIERNAQGDVETGSPRKIATATVTSENPDDAISQSSISHKTSSPISSQQSQWAIDSGGVVAGCETPSDSDRAKQKEYNKNLAAATVAALSKSNMMTGSGIGVKKNSGSKSSRHLLNTSDAGAGGNSTLSALWSHPKLFRRHTVVVLVNLQLLNLARDNQNNNINSSSSGNNNSDSIGAFTRNPTTVPVNKFGFPAGLGRNEDERSGPHLYVACVVKNVQQGAGLSSARALFATSSSVTSVGDDDVATSYCTVERCDTGTLQTVRSDWKVELLEDAVAIRAAMAAARTGNGNNENPYSDGYRGSSTLMSVESAAAATNQTGKARAFFAKFKKSMASNVIPPLRRLKLAAKAIATQLVQGKAPFSCKIRITGTGFVAVCSALFLFLQSFRLAWMPARMDDAFEVVEAVIWFVLVLDLIFEVMIRPSDYQQLIRSDKAYRPSTARYINQLFLVGESLALMTYTPEMLCMLSTKDFCYNNPFLHNLTLIEASVTAVLGPTRMDSAKGRLIMGLMAFRFFGVIRHWKIMLIRQIFSPRERYGIEKWIIPYDPDQDFKKPWSKRTKKKQDEEMTTDSDIVDADTNFSESKENRRLKSAANIGTALITVNCQRALVLMVFSIVVLPIIFAISIQNYTASNLTKLLQAENLVSTTSIGDCEYLEFAIDAWLNTVLTKPSTKEKDGNPFVLWAQVLPVRCPFQNETGVITSCTKKQSQHFQSKCEIWDDYFPPDLDDDTRTIRNYYASELNLRGGGIIVDQQPTGSFQFEALDVFKVTVIYNQNPTIEMSNKFCFAMLVIVFFSGLFFLLWLQNDVNTLALHPIQRMLRIVIRYAENPLSSDIDDDNNSRKLLSTRGTARDDIGDIETEQLLSAITKISGLLRKCWGVAGAGIISSNLGREKDGQVAVFNPTVPGKQVYALFGFVALSGYSELLKSLDQDVMILINDIAKVVHDEVYRWALGEHGQCNKNLGQAFLMVWRIGDFSEVQKKNKAAIEKIFRDKVYKSSKNNSNLRRRTARISYNRRNRAIPTTAIRKTSASVSGGSPEIQLESLPGIQGFADRALLGMLKSFAGIHRDKSLQRWKNDYRLTKSRSKRSTTSSYTVEVMYGMDAGWAVEGAVGSTYKIDATYLSPHVNMASRMMSASKQYGVTILLSKAVEKLLSKPCRAKLRNLDRVYVKGSAVKQSIYTYDARYSGVDFFLLEKTPEQADRESDAYTPAIWDQDQDLVAMRRHVTEDFLATYHRGVNQYLAGDWTDAYQSFEEADEIMIRTVLEEGYIEIADEEMLETLEDRILDKTDKGDDVVKLREEFGDGACRTLMKYIERRNFEAPTDWDGVRQLFSK